MEAENKVKAEARYVRVSPQKARLVVDLIRGRQADAARTVLRTTNKRTDKWIVTHKSKKR